MNRTSPFSPFPDEPAAGRPARAAERIRRTARELFYRDGIRAVGVDEIVTRAGATKPTLYRSFGSKDELAASYLKDYDAAFFQRFDDAIRPHAGDPRAQLVAYFRHVAQRVSIPGYRGCALTNAVVEYPGETDVHPGRAIAEANKRVLRARLRELAAAAGAANADTLGDALLLLLEGCFVSAQIFSGDPEGPARSVADAAEKLIAAYLPA
ncbi:TetR/AcrR family transcriptional regulator [Bordetella bronchialis]|uniref:TetR family transcriptional regulator n=1 Tax=Bordetella bronchialis TaxID=463025 RepID=A0A193FH21_9BORD|nr:TetR/AcrR family transcriptional regulator [Bordetella bronchialis]ANN66409.1 TetR family transcriptional regulator [Bordetella bronchialis]ANN71489.1 TetR family transcriptional regulator [Bordetella bronchialis]